MPAPSEIQIPASTAPGERERVAALSHPVARGGVGERSAPRPLRRKPNSSPECLHRQKPKSPPAQPHGRAREGHNPLAPRHPRGCIENPNSRQHSPGRAREGVNPLAPRRPINRACPAIPPLHYTSRVEKTQAIPTQIALIPARSTFVPRLIQRFPPFIHNPRVENSEKLPFYP